MNRTDEAKTKTQRLSDILVDIASQFFLAVVVGLVMAVVANTFVEGRALVPEFQPRRQLDFHANWRS
jgi:hypothetical protein